MTNDNDNNYIPNMKILELINKLLIRLNNFWKNYEIVKSCVKRKYCEQRINDLGDELNKKLLEMEVKEFVLQIERFTKLDDESKKDLSKDIEEGLKLDPKKISLDELKKKNVMIKNFINKHDSDPKIVTKIEEYKSLISDLDIKIKANKKFKELHKKYKNEVHENKQKWKKIKQKTNKLLDAIRTIEGFRLNGSKKNRKIFGGSRKSELNELEKIKKNTLLKLAQIIDLFKKNEYYSYN